MAFKSLVFLALCLAVAESQKYGYNNASGNGNINNGKEYCSALLPQTGVAFNCTNINRDRVSCSDRAPPGTTAELYCKNGYVMPDENVFTVMTCMMNGQWNREPYQCVKVPDAVGYNYSIGIGFYQLYRTPRSWWDAKLTCENDDGHLLVIDNAEERIVANAILTALSRSGRGNKTKKGGKGAASASSLNVSSSDLEAVYLGYSDGSTDGKMVSVTNTSMPREFSWCDGAKANKTFDNTKVTNCVAVHARKKCFVALPCVFKRSFICEIELPRRSKTSTSTSSSPGSTSGSG